MEFVDTNVFVRFITQDDADRGSRALEFFGALEDGPPRATTTEVIVAEVVYVIGPKTLYGLSRARVADELATLLTLPGFFIEHRSAMLRALDIFGTTTVDFADALVVAHAERLGVDAIVSFDRDYGRFPSVVRREP